MRIFDEFRISFFKFFDDFLSRKSCYFDLLQKRDVDLSVFIDCMTENLAQSRCLRTVLRVAVDRDLDFIAHSDSIVHISFRKFLEIFVESHLFDLEILFRNIGIFFKTGIGARTNEKNDCEKNQ